MSIKEPPSGAWRSPLNGNTKEALAWLARIVIGLLCWVAVDTLNTTRGEIREIRAAVVADANRITILETLRPEDRRLLEQIEQKVDRIAQRLGVAP